MEQSFSISCAAHHQQNQHINPGYTTRVAVVGSQFNVDNLPCPMLVATSFLLLLFRLTSHFPPFASINPLKEQFALAFSFLWIFLFARQVVEVTYCLDLAPHCMLHGVARRRREMFACVAASSESATLLLWIVCYAARRAVVFGWMRPVASL